MNEINNEQSPVMNNNNQNLKPTKSNNILVIVLLVIIVGLVGYMAYDKLIKKDTTTQNNNSQEEARQDETKQDETIKPAMSDADATDLGLNTYSKLQKFMDSLEVEEDSCKGNPNCGGNVAGNGAYLHKNFLNEFKSLFSSNVKLNDVFVEYDINNDTYKCNFSNDCIEQSAKNNYTYIVKNNEYYFDTFCRAGGCEAGSISDFKLVTNEENKLVYTYKVLRKKSVGDAMCDFESEKEYNDYVKNSQVYKLELVKEDNTWKVNRGSFIAKCNNTVSFNQ